MMDGGQLCTQFQRLSSRRGNWEQLWQEIGDRIWPDTADFTTERYQGESRTEKVYDSTAAIALERFASIRESLSTPRAEEWHKLRATDEKLNELPRVKAWFDDLTKLLFKMRERDGANFYASRHEGYKSKGAYGTSCLWLEPAPPGLGGGFRYRADPLSQVYIACDANGVPNVAFKKYKLTAFAAKMKWREGTPGWEMLPKVIKESPDPFNEFEFIKAVMPNDKYRQGAFGLQGQRYWCAEVSIAEKVLVEEGGFHEFPYIIGRHSRNAAEDYGRSPAMMLLPGIKTLDEMKKTFIRAGHRAVDPPLLTTEDGVLGAGGSRAPRVLPGGINYGGLDDRGNPLVKPMVTGMRLDLTEEMMNTERVTINDGFGINLFQILVDREGDMTATEVLERAQEKGQLIAPEIGREQSEELGPMIFREVKILARQGFFMEDGTLPMPPELVEAQGDFEIVYDSPATRFQKRGQGAAIIRTMEIWAPFIQADPGLMGETFDASKGMRQTALNEGAPGDWIRSEEDAAKIRQARLDQMQAEKEAAAMPDAARAAKDAVGAAQGAQQLAG